MVAVLCKTYGLQNIQVAEDLVSDTFLVASETWGVKGVPQKPSAWLYTVAKNKAKDLFKHNKVFEEKVKPELLRSEDLVEELNFSEQNISDSQLQLFFAVCNPIISSEAQVTLALRILCGFGINEIASAFLSNKDTINKRLLRAKEKLRVNNVELTFPSVDELSKRLDNVLTIIYLLFNEGYHSSTSTKNIDRELCVEAMRLTYFLLENKTTNKPKTNALMALLCFHSSRFEARMNKIEEIVLFENQDRKLWNYELITKGSYYLSQSLETPASKLQIEASIAFLHTQDEETLNKWETILQLHNNLLQLEYTPIVALNRTYSLAKVKGNEVAIKEVLKINLSKSHLYHVLLAELYKPIDKEKQLNHLNIALGLVKTKQEKQVIFNKIESILNNSFEKSIPQFPSAKR